jgi:hypothetical protein
VIGNTWPCDNFFKKAIKAGVVWNKDKTYKLRNVIRIKAVDSPNVKLALDQIAEGRQPSHEQVIPGVKSYREYENELVIWDEIQRCVSHDAMFYEGSEILLFPALWLARANRIAQALQGKKRYAKAVGIDTAEGGDRTAMACIDELGLIELVSKKTPNTAVITGEAIAFGRKHGVPPSDWCFDAGGGGKQHADRLRAMGLPVRTVAFGESVKLDLRRGLHQLSARKDERETAYAYKDRRAQMYGELSRALDESVNSKGFAIPAKYDNLLQELAPIPKEYDEEGQLMLRPKHRKPGQKEKDHKTLVELIGHSPDEADALAIAHHCMTVKHVRSVAGSAI